ncbi:hypothetical protein Q4566_15315 [Tamlana sp. 2_MG-2023]|uniref:hypothetical protein n=1 Tax=unclassified Tamlana TaxID=2614803 RepID=UPI0026E18A9B|nr:MULTISPECIES: hypothetical protein [unclassified Tamlana]MDO6761578.1 hypothetical protein [Tamlana sp. 2_MG-2023]MDO6792292.1 hypothetical protein [Tamlana sp. 1_MG-2023]
MKTSLLLSVLVFLSVCSLYSQEKDYKFNRLNTRKQTLKGQSTSDIYAVSYVKTEEVINPEYTKLISELNNVLADSISINTKYKKAFIKFTDMSTIKSKVVAFNSSAEPFGNKVILLKEAQILASKHNIKELLYSDNDINKEMKAGFLLLRLNINDLEAHLNRVLERLDNNIKTPEEPVYTSTVALRRKISNTKKLNNDNDAKKTKGYILQNSIVPPEDITGDFRFVNKYFVLKMPTNGLIKNQLITKKMVYRFGIARKKLFSSNEKMLIQNKRTEDMYLVDNSFLDNFSVKG